MPEDKSNPDRDILIRVDADLKHLNDTVKEVRDRQGIQEQNQAQLTLNLNTLTLNIGALVSGMTEMKNAMSLVGQHDTRLHNLEQRLDHQDEKIDEVEADIMKELEEVKDEIADDKKQWQPVISFFEHWKWLLAGVAGIVAVVGWPFINAVGKVVFNS